MTTNSDHNRGEPLIDAILRDDDWQTASAAFKARAVGSFRARQRARRMTRWGGVVAACALLLSGTVRWFGRPVAPLRTSPIAKMQPPDKPMRPRSLSDRELLAAFPKGSCFIAEVDGKKLLVFLDPEVKQAYLADPGAAATSP